MVNENWVTKIDLASFIENLRTRGGGGYPELGVVSAYARFGDGQTFLFEGVDGSRVVKHTIVSRNTFESLVAAGIPKEAGHDMIRLWPYVITPTDSPMMGEVANPSAEKQPHFLDVANSLHELENQIETAEENANGRHEVIIKTIAEQARIALDREDKLGGLLSRLLTAIEVPHRNQVFSFPEGPHLDELNRHTLVTSGIVDEPPGSNGRISCCCGRQGCKLSWLRIGVGIVAGSTHTDCGYTLDAQDGIAVDHA